MSKRTRSHILEEESWRVLESTKPAHWVLRKPHPDYGLDGEIEVFDEKGTSTGLMFLVQLKGTDEKNIKKALSLQLPVEKIKEYKTYDLPVLLVRFCSSSKAQYVKWALEVDLHFAIKKKSKSITVEFEPESIWVEGTATRLIEDISAFKLFTNPRLPIPIGFRFNFPAPEVFSVAVGKVEALIRTTASPMSRVISFDSGWKDVTIPKITITDELIQVNLLGLSSFNLRLTKNAYGTIDVENRMPHDVMVGLAIFLHRLGYDTYAADIVLNHLERSSLLNHVILLKEIVAGSMRGNRVDVALRVAEMILDKGKDKFLYQVLMMPAFMKSEVSEEDFVVLKRLLLKAADYTRKNYPIGAGSCYLNLGRRLLRKAGSTKEALHYFNRAAKCNSEYKTREYYLAEVAGLLFRAGRYSLSAVYYAKALRNGSENSCIALRADALMFAGRYKEALESFKEYERSAGKIEGEWCLKKLVLEDIVGTYKIETQHRQLNLALSYGIVPAEIDITSKEIGEKLLHALSLDALCSLVWFNLGERHWAMNQHCEAASSFIAAAAALPTVSHAWAKAIVCIMNCKEYVPLIPLMLAMIAFYNVKDGVIKDISGIIESQPENKMPKSKKIEMINAISSLIREMEKEKTSGVAWRVINPDGTYSEL